MIGPSSSPLHITKVEKAGQLQIPASAWRCPSPEGLLRSTVEKPVTLQEACLAAVFSLASRGTREPGIPIRVLREGEKPSPVSRLPERANTPPPLPPPRLTPP